MPLTTNSLKSQKNIKTIFTRFLTSCKSGGVKHFVTFVTVFNLDQSFNNTYEEHYSIET